MTRDELNELKAVVREGFGFATKTDAGNCVIAVTRTK